MIEPIEGRGVHRVNAICDECDRRETVACDYLRKSGGQWEPNEGQVKKKLSMTGWANVKGKMYCPSCEAKRKVIQVKKSEQKTEAPREPTRAQKREIMDMLETVYDTDTERYKAGDTDDTVADVLDVMPGWVAQIREDFFGPDGGNEEIERIQKELADFKAVATKQLKASVDINDDLRKLIEKATGFSEAVSRIQKAVGPRNLTKAGIK